MSQDKLTVLKFGSSTLRTEDDLAVVVEEVRLWLDKGSRVIAVVSAFGGTTERLFARGRKYGEGCNEEGLAALVATGEQTSAALLVLALGKAGISGKLLDPAQVRLQAEGPALDAQLSGVDAGVVRTALRGCQAVVIPGFVARSSHGATVLLGRGGSDLTALFLAHKLGADRCRLIKDVDGLYASDPKASNSGRLQRCQHLRWEEALRLNGRVVQHKALSFAAENKVVFEVAALGGADGTRVGENFRESGAEDGTGDSPA